MQKYFNMFTAGEIIALSSLIITVASLFSTIYFNIKTRNQYRQSLTPLLSFRLIEYKQILYLAITNTGRSEAKNIKIEIEELCNNGDRNNVETDDLFKNEFELFPNETVQGKVGLYGENISNTAFPYVRLIVEYIKGNDNTKASYTRTISFTTGHENKIAAEVDLDLGTISGDIKALNRSNIRIANYLDGCTLSSVDELDIETENSLKNDLKEAIHSSKKTTRKSRNQTINEESKRRKSLKNSF